MCEQDNNNKKKRFAHLPVSFSPAGLLLVKEDKTDGCAELNVKSWRKETSILKLSSNKRTPCDGGVYFFEFMSCAA